MGADDALTTWIRAKREMLMQRVRCFPPLLALEAELIELKIQHKYNFLFLTGVKVYASKKNSN